MVWWWTGEQIGGCQLRWLTWLIFITRTVSCGSLDETWAREGQGVCGLFSCSYKCASVSIRNMHLEILIIVLHFRLFKNSQYIVSHPFPFSKGGSREADGNQREAKWEARLCDGKALKKRNYLGRNEGEKRLMEMTGKRCRSYLSNGASLLIPQSLPSFFSKSFSFIMSLLLHEGAQKALKHSCSWHHFIRTIQTYLFSITFTLQRKIWDRDTKWSRQYLTVPKGSYCTTRINYVLSNCCMVGTLSHHKG